ncbi:(deoxy)nucleoside triphosphate pyrophosphohydrolase [Microbacterium oleivorans]|uniref:8-oxo-dGTP diphosphatase n=1 Tax=Microbacterium oleivorans TaxID=273677 RepID=A0A7D5EWL9_9MICO|nr:NUDIX domain-containing protein [Microbacterium oleivorans]QLD11666.1 NUDIX domain-containing protein [Microbacterium oleivorans]
MLGLDGRMGDNEAMSTPMRVAAAIVVNDAGRVLIGRRRPGLRSAGCWEFPGGKLEAGEAPPDAIVRELREELSIEVKPGEELCRSIAVDENIELICVWATLVSAAPLRSTDHDIFLWESPESLPLSGWCAPDLEAVALLRRGATSPTTYT